LGRGALGVASAVWGLPAATKIEGIGAGFIPKVLNMQILDEIIAVDDDDA
jgi:cysteine synthase A